MEGGNFKNKMLLLIKKCDVVVKKTQGFWGFPKLSKCKYQVASNLLAEKTYTINFRTIEK